MAFSQAHALVIGVGTHQNAPRINVPITVSDAKAVVEILQDGNICGYPANQVTLLHDSETTKVGILAALQALAGRVKAEDTVFFYYCGHGASGTDGNYYLVSHDARMDHDRVIAGTGLSEKELLEGLRAIPAKRVLMVFNACFSGNISPTLAIEGQELAASALPEDVSNALLATGEGRVIIVASRESQYSHVGSGTLTIFTQALVDGLRGKGVSNSGGFISAYSLYEHIYEAVSETVKEKYHAAQEPELTVLKGVGPFAVALYKGATTLGEFDGASQPVPDLPAVRQVDAKKAQRALGNYGVVQGSGPPVQGNNNQVVGAGGILVGGSMTGDIVTGQKTAINTGGAAYIGGNVNAGGDFVGRDKIVHGDEVRGDKIGGDKFDVKVSGRTGVAIGRNARAEVHQTTGMTGQEIERLFLPLIQAVRAAPPADQAQALQKVEELKAEIQKGKQADDKVQAKLINGLIALVPGAVSAVVSMFASPVLAGLVGPVTSFMLDQIQGK